MLATGNVTSPLIVHHAPPETSTSCPILLQEPMATPTEPCGSWSGPSTLPLASSHPPLTLPLSSWSIFLHLEFGYGDGKDKGNISDDNEETGDLETLLWPLELLHRPQKMDRLGNRLESYDQKGKTGRRSVPSIVAAKPLQMGRATRQWRDRALAAYESKWPCRAGLGGATSRMRKARSRGRRARHRLGGPSHRVEG